MSDLIGIMSDIHGNIDALKAVLRDARRQGIKRFWMLGDAVGYGLDAVSVLDKLHDLKPEHWLAGNHDWAVVRAYDKDRGIDFADFNDLAKDGIRRHYAALQYEEASKGYITHLASLPYHQKVGDNIFIAHGNYCHPHNDHHYPEITQSVVGINRYTEAFIQIEWDLKVNYDEWTAPLASHPVLTFYGHTHKPVFWERQKIETDDVAPVANQNDMSLTLTNTRWKRYVLGKDETDGWFAIQPGKLYHINVGSVGFPRNDSYPCPSYVVYDPAKQRLQFRFVSYDVEATRARMREARIEHGIYARYLLTCPPDSKHQR